MPSGQDGTGQLPGRGYRLAQSELYRLCGLTDIKRPESTREWDKAELRYIGADGYVLRTEFIDAQFIQNKKGIELNTKHRMMAHTNKLLGAKCKVGMLYDVIVVIGALTLSLASIMPDMYPKVLRKDQELTLI